MKFYITCLCISLFAFVSGCTTIEETAAPMNDELTVSIDVPADLVTDTTAYIIFTKSRPAHYRIEVIGPVYEQVSDYLEGDDFDLNFNTFTLPETGLHPDTGYLVVIYMDDQDGNTASAHTSFRTKPAVTATELEISNISVIEDWGGTNAKAISFDLNEMAFWEIQVDDWTTGSGYYTISNGVGAGAIVALYLTTGHDYQLRILAYTQEGDFALEVISLGTW